MKTTRNSNQTEHVEKEWRYQVLVNEEQKKNISVFNGQLVIY